MKTIYLAVLLSLAAGVPAKVWINEVMPDPVSGLSADEWIEIAADMPTDLTGCYLREDGGQVTNLEGTISDFLVIDDPRGTLNNDNEGVSLICPDATDRVEYTAGPERGHSLGLDESGQWIEYETPTKGAANFASQA